MSDKIAQAMRRVAKKLETKVAIPISLSMLCSILKQVADEIELRITKTEGVCRGVACIAGTRISVWQIAQYRKQEHLVYDKFPELSNEDIEAAFDYADKNKKEIEAQIKENKDA